MECSSALQGVQDWKPLHCPAMLWPPTPDVDVTSHINLFGQLSLLHLQGP